MTIYFYELLHPVTKEVRYIGKTVNLQQRQYEHNTKIKETSYKHSWVKSLKAQGLLPEMRELVDQRWEIAGDEDDGSWKPREIALIKKYREEGYRLTNLTEGGDGLVLNTELRKKMSDVQKGKQHSLGKHWTEESNQKRRDKNTHKKSIDQFDMEGNFVKRWETVTMASKVLGLTRSNLNQVLKGKRRIVKNFYFRYADLSQSPPLKTDVPQKKTTLGQNINTQSNRNREINQFDLEGNFIKRWDKSSAAATALGISPSGIGHVLNGKKCLVGGFYFKYANKSKLIPNKVKVPTHRGNNVTKNIDQFDLDGNFIKRWDNISEIIKEFGMNKKNLMSTIKGNVRSTGGFHFAKADLSKPIPTKVEIPYPQLKDLPPSTSV